MDRQTLVSALERLTKSGTLQDEDGRAVVAEDHRLTFYIGQPGQAMVVKQVTSIELDGELALLEKGDGTDKGTLLVATADIHGVMVHPPKAREDRRAGFA